MGGGQVVLVIDDLGQQIGDLEYVKKVDDLVIPRRCGDGHLPQKIDVIWRFWL